MNVSINDDSVLELDETFNVLLELGTTAARTSITLNKTRLQLTIMDMETGIANKWKNHFIGGG